jgi:hypothetical protein
MKGEGQMTDKQAAKKILKLFPELMPVYIEQVLNENSQTALTLLEKVRTGLYYDFASDEEFARNFMKLLDELYKGGPELQATVDAILLEKIAGNREILEFILPLTRKTFRQHVQELLISADRPTVEEKVL